MISGYKHYKLYQLIRISCLGIKGDSGLGLGVIIGARIKGYSCYALYYFGYNV